MACSSAECRIALSARSLGRSNLSIHRSWMSCSGTGLRWCNFSRPRQVVLIRLAASSRARCCDADWRAMDSEPHSSPRVCPSCSCSRSSSCRRDGSASALNTRFRSSATRPFMQVFPCMSRSADTVADMEIAAPADDDDVPRFWRELGLPGLVDTHVHFLPERVQAKVWRYFENGGGNYGVPWPLAYAQPVEDRLAILDRLGVRAFPTLPYPHKAGMAAWLNDWSAEFAGRHPQVLHSATFYPEPEAPAYVAEALDRGARVFKVPVQVGAFDPRHALLDPVWARLE